MYTVSVYCILYTDKAIRHRKCIDFRVCYEVYTAPCTLYNVHCTVYSIMSSGTEILLRNTGPELKTLIRNRRVACLHGVK